MEIVGAPVAVKKALAAVVVARAKWQTVDEIDGETKNEILAAHEFLEEDGGDRIADYKRDFLMPDADFERYCELVYQRNLGKGIDSGGAGLTFWPVHKAVYDAEDALIDAVTADIPQYTASMIQEVKRDHKLRARFLEISGL